jgi:light-harvesting complex 1 alpha chain
MGAQGGVGQIVGVLVQEDSMSEANILWRVWTQFEPRKIPVPAAAGLFALALLIHVVLLGANRFNWLDGPSPQRPVGQFLPPVVK